MADPTLRELARRYRDAWGVFAAGMRSKTNTPEVYAELDAARDAFKSFESWHERAAFVLAELDAERAAGRRAADDEVLDALRREKAALDSLEAQKVAHAAEVENLKAEINALNKALREECE